MNDLAWRKFPVNTIRNEELDYISYLLPKSLSAAPYMFYMTAICKCDDDGVFDIEDGVIFSRLMRMGSPGDVMEIAKMLTERRILTQVTASKPSIYMITDWDAPDRRGVVKTKTAEERRAIIAAKIEAEQNARLQRQPQPAYRPQPEIQIPNEIWTQPAQITGKPFNTVDNPAVDFSQMRDAVQPASAAFFCPDFDKNAQIVEKTERERENKESIRDTHTENTEDMREEREADTACGPMEGPTAVSTEENKAETKDQTQEAEPEEQEMYEPSPELQGNLAEQAIGISDEGEKESAPEEAIKALEDIANDFFVRNSLVFVKDADAHAIRTLAERVYRLKTPNNPPEIVMKTILRQFKIRATTKTDYFYGCNFTPQFLLSENTWKHILSQCSALLMTHKEDNSEWQLQMMVKNPEEQAAIDDDIKAQCLKYGVDPSDPKRITKLLAKQAASATAQNTG